MAKLLRSNRPFGQTSQLLRESKSPLICGPRSTLHRSPASFLENCGYLKSDYRYYIYKPRTLKYFFPFKKPERSPPRLEKSKVVQTSSFFGFVILKSLTPDSLERINPQDTNRSQRILVVGDQETATTKIANRFIQVSSENAFELLVNVRSQLESLSKTPTSLPAKDCLSDIEITANELVKELVGAKYGSILYQQVTENSSIRLNQRFSIGADSKSQRYNSIYRLKASHGRQCSKCRERSCLE